MQNNDKKKICIVVSSLGKGGAEKSSAISSCMLSDLGYDVSIVTILDEIDYTFKGRLLNLGELKRKNDSLFGKISRYFTFYKFLRRNKFDFIIDNRSRNLWYREIILSKFFYRKAKLIYVVRSYHTETYFPKSAILSKLLYGKKCLIISVSNNIKRKLEDNYNFNNVVTINNSVTFNTNVQKLETEDNFILAYGRIDDAVKNYSLLIDSYKRSRLPKANIKLYIMGFGKDLEMLKLKVINYGLTDFIKFLPFTNNPEIYIESAKFVCLTSRYEGFPRVLIESLSLGTPVVSVDCKSGPSEIIKNEYNGLLVENFNETALSNAMNRMVEDKNFRNTCKENTKKSVEQFSYENIKKDWKQLLESL